MSVFRYCDRCGAEMREPTLREDLTGEMVCQVCNYPHGYFRSTREVALELLDLIEALEKRSQSND